MKHTKFLYAGALLGSILTGMALNAETHVTNIIQYCTGDSAICRQKGRVNAIGDVVNIDVSKYPVKALGKITEEKLMTLALPEKEGEKVIYSFIPTVGDFAGQLVYVVFDYLVARPGSRIAGKSTVMLYRSLEGAKATQWTEIATITMLAKDVKLQPIEVTVKPDGTGVWIDPQTNKPEIFLIGRKDFSAERRAAEAQKVAEAQKATDAATKAAA